MYVACLCDLQRHDYALHSSAVEFFIELEAAAGKITNVSGSPNLLLQVNGACVYMESASVCVCVYACWMCLDVVGVYTLPEAAMCVAWHVVTAHASCVCVIVLLACTDCGVMIAGCATSCDCDDGNRCTIDTCSTSTKKCVYTFNFACKCVRAVVVRVCVCVCVCGCCGNDRDSECGTWLSECLGDGCGAGSWVLATMMCCLGPFGFVGWLCAGLTPTDIIKSPLSGLP